LGDLSVIERTVPGCVIPNSTPSAPHVDTCDVHFPRLMSDADALEHPAAAMISASGTLPSLGTISRRNNSRSQTAPGLALSHSDTARLRAMIGQLPAIREQPLSVQRARHFG
jgi:hypothetical protein